MCTVQPEHTAIGTVSHNALLSTWPSISSVCLFDFFFKCDDNWTPFAQRLHTAMKHLSLHTALFMYYILYMCSEHYGSIPFQTCHYRNVKQANKFIFMWRDIDTHAVYTSSFMFSTLVSLNINSGVRNQILLGKCYQMNLKKDRSCFACEAKWNEMKWELGWRMCCFGGVVSVLETCVKWKGLIF